MGKDIKRRMDTLSWKIFTLYGIPVRLHFSLPVLLLFFMLKTGGFWMGTAVFLLLFVGVVLHEAGHCLWVLAGGGRVRSVELWCLGGAAEVVSPPRMLGDEIKIALAGPAVSLALAVFFALLRLPVGAAEGSRTVAFLDWAVTLNLMLCGFNLLPAFPLDVGRGVRDFLARLLGVLPATMLMVRLGKFLAVATGIVGLFRQSVLLILLAVMMYLAADQELNAVLAGGRSENEPWPGPTDRSRDPAPPEIKIGPPPYEQERGNSEKIREFLRKWFKV